MTTTEISAEVDQDRPADGPSAPPDHAERAEPTAVLDGVSANGDQDTRSLVASIGDLELLFVDPRELIVGVNTRKNVVLDKNFVRDIRRRGVREPIITRRGGGRDLVVRKGQKRTLGAIEAGLERVLVIVEPELITDETAREIDRIVDQLGENEHRSGIDEVDELGATQELLALGLKARQIARERSIPLKRVETTVKVAQSEAARKAVTEANLDLTQAVVIAEFSDDEEAVAALTEYARTRPEQFDHLTQRLRDRREEAQLCQEATDTLVADGVTVIDRPDNLYSASAKVRRLTELRATPHTKAETKLTVKRHAKCPGHAAFLEYRSWLPAGKRVVVTYVCTDFTGNGHAELRAAAGKVTSSYSGTGRAAGPMSEAEKAARRRVIRNGKDWDSAKKVRRTWLKTFASRKSAPRDALSWIGQMWAEGTHELRKAMETDHALAVELLGLATKDDRTRYNRRATHPIADAAAKATPGRATMLTLIMVLAAIEEGTNRRHTWDTPSPAERSYFAQLKTWSYPLSPVEELVIAPAESTTLTNNAGDSEEGPEPAIPESEEDNTIEPGGSNVAEDGAGLPAPTDSAQWENEATESVDEPVLADDHADDHAADYAVDLAG